jgi:hypothetical protein
VSRARVSLAIAVLVLVAIGIGLLASAGPRDKGTPTLDDRGPRGLGVLAAWLGPQRVRSWARPIDHLDRELRTFVIVAPTVAELTDAEVEVLQGWVKQGGTLVWLTSRTLPQPALGRWLPTSPGPTLPLDGDPGLGDVGGATVRVELNGGPFRDLHALRVSAERTVQLGRDDAVPVAGRSLWWLREGLGEVLVGAGPDLAENSRLELLDNAQLWRALAARGPMAFDDFHHQQAAAPRTPLTLALTLAQLVVVGLAFIAVFGSRLGPVSPSAPPQPRAAVEYVRAMAALTRRVADQRPLTQAVRAQARALLTERLGLAPTLDELELERTLAARAPDTLTPYRALKAGQSLLEVSVQAAKLERSLR